MTKRHDPESLIDFPCHYQFKAIGNGGETFRRDVVQAVSVHVPVSRDSVRAQPSRLGNYQSVSVVLTIHNAAQLKDIYSELNKVSGLKMLL